MQTDSPLKYGRKINIFEFKEKNAFGYSSIEMSLSIKQSHNNIFKLANTQKVNTSQISK